MSSLSSSWGNAPQDDEFEVSVFGPGTGECIVLHLGHQRWMVVDSCRGPSRRPIALEYLRSIDVNFTLVSDIVVTHWHDDHHDGAADLLDACAEARLWCSSALRTAEFKTLAGAARHRIADGTGVDELADVLAVVGKRRKKGARKAGTGPEWLAARTLLVRSDSTHVLALSPSSTEQTLARQEIAELIPQFDSGKRRLVSRMPNHVSVVLHVRVGDHVVLLGSDLETGTDPGIGWTGVAHVADDLACERCHILKVPHHGSPTGHSDTLWKQLVATESHAVVTPFRSCGLPSDGDLNRLLAHTGELAATAPTSAKKLKPRPASVEKTMRRHTKSRKAISAGLGHVRYRGKLHTDEPPTRELFGQAYLPRLPSETHAAR